MRQLRDEAGVEWMVYAVNPVGANEWRSIESPTEKRRLTPLPPEWENLPLEQLTGLLGTAILVQRSVKYSQ